MRVDVGRRSDGSTLQATRRPSPALTVLLCLIALGVAVRLADPSSVPWLRNLVIVFGSLLVEATPFILLGAAVSAAIEVFVPSSVFARIALLPRALQLPAAAAAGVAFPVCECGSVPVARRLASKGLAPSAAVTFMLAAPVVNPVVVASTFIAYRGRDTLWIMVLGRLALGFVVAMTVGWVMGRIGSGELLRARSAGAAEPEDDEDGSRGRRFVDHLAGDTMFMGRFLIAGAALAAAIQTFVPRSVVDGVASLPVLSLLAMMALAFVMSLCSESDAFVAASFTAFGPSAQLAFLVFGPMVDLKLAALYVGTYRRGFLRAVVIAAGTTTLVCTLWIQVIWG
jgi:uncharacterized membrane protein YraQ (UPF0718 family)